MIYYHCTLLYFFLLLLVILPMNGNMNDWVNLSKENRSSFISEQPLSIIFKFTNNNSIQKFSNLTKKIEEQTNTLPSTIPIGLLFNPNSTEEFSIHIYYEDINKSILHKHLKENSTELIISEIIDIYHTVNIHYIIPEEIHLFSPSSFNQNKYGLIVFSDNLKEDHILFHQNISYQIKEVFDVYASSIDNYNKLIPLFNVSSSISFESTNEDSSEYIALSYNPSTQDSIVIHFNGNYINLFDVIMLYSFPNTINFNNPKQSNVINALKQSSWGENFILIYSKEKDGEEVLAQFDEIAEIFHMKHSIPVWFGYLNIDVFPDEKDNQDLTTPICFLYETFLDNDIESQYTHNITFEELYYALYLHNKNDVEEENENNTSENPTEEEVEEEGSRLKSLYEVNDEKDLYQYDHFILFIYDENKESSFKYHKFIFMLERFHYLLNEEDYPIFSITKQQTKGKDLIHISGIKDMKIVLFSKDKKEDAFSYSLYEKGPSISLFCDFFNTVYETEFSVSEKEVLRYYDEMVKNDEHNEKVMEESSKKIDYLKRDYEDDDEVLIDEGDDDDDDEGDDEEDVNYADL